MRISLVIYSLGPGGAERVITKMARHWIARDEDVALITLEAEDSDFYRLDRRIDRRIAGTIRMALRPSEIWRVTHSLRRLRAHISDSEPDVVVSFIDKMNLVTLSALRKRRVPVIVGERTDPRHQPLPRRWELLRRRLYRRADAIVVQTDRVAEWARSLWPGALIRVIPNPVETPDRSRPSFTGPEGKIVAAAGRLSREKGFDLLMHAFARCAPGHSEWSIVIFGDGPERDSLDGLASSLGIADRVHMPGVVNGLPATLAATDLFVLSSRWEGFPNSLLEAMAGGTAAVSFDCPSGPREIIMDGVDGILVPPEDVDALADAMDRLMSDETERRRLGDEARRVTERFSLERVMSMWDELIHEVTA